MNILGLASYGAAALGFLLLTILLLVSWQGRSVGARLIAAAALTCVWALALLGAQLSAQVPAFAVYLAEVVRDASWIWLLVGVAAPMVPRLLVRVVLGVAGMLLLAGLVLPLVEILGIGAPDIGLLLSRAGLAMSLAGLVLLEQIYRNSNLSARQSLRYFVLGVGALFAYDLFLYSQAELLGGISSDAWSARGVVNAISVPLIALAVRRNPQWSLNIFVSRQVIFHTTTFGAVGTYLLLMGAGGYYVRAMGGSWGGVAQILFFAGAIVVLATLISSGVLRRRARVFISKHFYRNKYDYRITWLQFIQTLSSRADEDVRRTGVRAVAQILSSPGGVLFTLDEASRNFVPAGAWPLQHEAVENIGDVRMDSELAQFLVRTQWIIDMREYRRTPDAYQNIELPGWLLAHEGLRIISPLLSLERLVGFFVLYDPPPPFELTYEDRDLLKTVGRHVATHIAQHEMDRKLAEGRQFEAYNRLTAFLMHDLKNSVAQLNLVVANAARHKHNPEFIEDAIGTIANTVERMTRMIEQLRGSPTSRLKDVALNELAAGAIARCRDRQPQPRLEAADDILVHADPERLGAVVEHLIRNAQDASSERDSVWLRVKRGDQEATLSIVDTGSGMDPRFVRERLFRPFDSTKGSKGMGIGAYQAREYVRSLGGRVEVQSSPGHGTTFSITLPTVPRPALLATAEDVPEGSEVKPDRSAALTSTKPMPARSSELETFAGDVDAWPVKD